jgi:hypothetical protein
MLSLAVVGLLYSPPNSSYSASHIGVDYDSLKQVYVNREVADFNAKCLFVLQPQFMFLVLWQNMHNMLSVRAITALGLLSVPLWSFCFSCIFVRFDNWLNHFPILGRKVF